MSRAAQPEEALVDPNGKVLFIGVHNSSRSQMAEAFFNSEAESRGLELRAISAGTRGAGALNILTVRAMAELGIAMEGQSPKQLKSEMIERASRIVSVGVDVNGEKGLARFVPSDEWTLDDPGGRSFGEVRRIRDEIRALVEAMVVRLEA